MTHSPALVRVGLGSARWLLPWIAALLVSATLAYAITSAITGGSSESDQQPYVPVAMSTGEAARTERCAAKGGGLMHVGLDSWIVAESQRIGCECALTC